MDKSIYKKMQANSCVLSDDNIYFYTVLGDLMKFNIEDSSICILGEVLCEKIPSIHSIFNIKSKLYHINNNDFNVYDQFGNVCVVFKELCNQPSFIYCTQQDNKYIHIIDGNGHLYKNIDVITGEYDVYNIGDLIYAKSFSDRIIWIDVHNNIRAYFFKSNVVKDMGKFNCNGEIESICYDVADNYYLLNNMGEIYVSDLEFCNTKKIATVGAREYIDMNCIDGNIVVFPKLLSNEIVYVNLSESNKISYVEYPEDAFFFADSVVMFSRYTENDKYIIYPMRGLDYFLIINKESFKINWVRPSVDKEFKIDMKEKIDKIREVIQEGTITLTDFIDGVVNK